MGTDVVRADADWLALREPVDAGSRAASLVDVLRPLLPTGRRLSVHDLGAGTGAMARWLAPLLPVPQHWVLHDRDAELLGRVATHPPPSAAGGAAVTVETRVGDITRLGPDALRDADLLTGSALLDMMSAPELEELVASCARPSCPVLVTLSVVGRVELTPPDALDGQVAAAFDAHQRRSVAGRTLLGPDAVGVAGSLFGRLGYDVTVRPSPWRLGPDDTALAAEWFSGWVAAAGEQRRDLRRPLAPYTRRRMAQVAAGALAVTVHHQDLLARPPGPS